MASPEKVRVTLTDLLRETEVKEVVADTEGKSDEERELLVVVVG